jgi:predicted permease
VVLFFVENVLHYSLGTWMLDHKARLITLWRVPVIAAALAGLAISLSGFPLWQPLWFAVKMLGDVSIPLLLFSLGVRLTESRHGDWTVGLAGAVTSPLAGVAMALLANWIIGLEGREAAMLILFGALPPAVLNYIFAERYGQEPDRVASIVLIGNTASLAIIPLCLAWVLR